MSRQDVRTGIATYFGGSTLDDRGFYRPTPLAALGLAGVRAYWTDRFDDNRDYFDGLTAPATFGVIMAVNLTTTTERRLAIGGTLDRPYAVDLYLFYYATTTPPPEAVQASMDDLLDAIVARMRADPTLGMGAGSGAPTIVTQAGEGTRGITVNSPPPYYEPNAFTKGQAVISFDASTYPNIA